MKYKTFCMLTLLMVCCVFCAPRVNAAHHEEGDMDKAGAHDCRSDPQRGECQKFTPHWFYNVTSKRCEQFWYGGCGGNGNNYKTQEECQTHCRHADRGTDNIVISEDDAKVKETDRISSPASSKCMQSSDRGRFCAQWEAKWYFNSDSGVCERFWYGGCDGNENRFNDKESCMQACTRSEDVCKMPVVMGNCRERLPRWYYISAIQECRSFEYSGCNGNGNRFMTKEDCQRQCVARREAFERTDCGRSRYGCCPDRVTSAKGNNYEGCSSACKETRYGCCDDDITPAQGPEQEGCEVIEISSGDGVACGETDYGCCPDKETAATGPNQAGCGGVILLTDKSDTDITVDVPGQCKQPSELGTCRDNMVVMWFYNTTGNRCDMFWYGGCNGNENRFKSEKECLTICREVVTEETADNKEESISVCDQPKEIGPCRSLIERWFYNKDTRQCEQFGYGGCRGNQNNFEDRTTCERYCRRGTPISKAGQCPRVIVDEEDCSSTCNYDGDCSGAEKCCSSPAGCRNCYAPADNEIILTQEEICAQDKETGPCRAAFTRFFFNKVTNQCESFIYGGCRGNKNNFESKDLCQRYCRRSIESTNRPSLRQNICELRPALGPCDRNLTKYFYDTNTLSCRTFTYGGCLGNHNNFATEAKCMSYCGLRRRNLDKEEICKQSYEQGSCRASFSRYYYDARQGRCFEFNYGGCQGNDNNFPNEESCMNSCEGVRIEDRVIGDRRPRPRPRPTIQPPKEDNTAEGREEDVCSLPLQTPCTVNRTGPFWYYDRRTGICREVPNAECNNNRNNFQSRSQCESYCNRERVCMPLYYTSDIRCLALIPSWTYNGRTGRCEEFNYGGCGGSANNFADEDSCRRKCEERVIISATDAPEDASPADVCAMPEDGGNCLASMQKWRYDMTTGQCVQFQWGGCGGNKNNFDSRQACESYCSRRVVCQAYEEPDIGCFAYLRRWRYDPTSNQCESFIYGGCGGNANNFESFESCEGKCMRQTEVPSNRETNEMDNRVSSWRDICVMKYNPGPCDQRVQKWYYNPAIRGCETFSYGGCLGNHNNFESKSQCMTYCGNVFGNGLTPTEDPDEVVGSGDVTTDPSGVEVCHLISETGVCRALINMWYYNSLDGECQRFVYGGCGGNANRFSSKEDCERQCNERDICLLRSDSGMGYNYTTRYHFDYSSQKCQSFVYGGEDGNANNFVTEETCLRRCNSLIRRIPVTSSKHGVCPALFFPKYSSTCLKQCNEDGNCAGQKKCCPLGCNLICLDPDRNYMPPKGGECPARKRTEGLLGACAPQCREDSQCSGNQKCCYSGCGYKCVDPVSAVKSGECPARRRTEGLLGACAPQCREDSQCSGNQKCCYSGCGYRCVDPVSEQTGPKAGYCPARVDWQGLLGACAPQCQDDRDCVGAQKCCNYGCGLQCVNPVADEPYQMDAPDRVEARAVDENSIHVTWADPSLGQDQRIRDRRFYTIRYFSYDHGQYNYMNVTDLRGHVNTLTSDTEYHFSIRANNPPYLSEWSTDVMSTTRSRVEDVCSLPMDRGECSDWVMRWYYTRDENGMGLCDMFWFGGCEEQGNRNRFENQTDCEAACGSPVTEVPRTPRPYDCRRSIYGCCEDRYTPAVDSEKSNCQVNLRDYDEIVAAVPGESVTLRCRSSSNVTWYRDGKLVESNDRREVNNDGTLVVFKATIVDDGLYACHVYRDSSLPTIYRYTLQVRIPIGIIDESPDTIIVKPNHMAFLHCEAYGNPKPTVTWQKNGQPLRTGARYETFTNGTLLIRRATAEDIDRYTCIADNKVTPSVSRTIGLNLREMLVARIENDNGRVTEGGVITLTCEGRGYPTPTITWEKMGQPLRTGGNVYISSAGKLVIREANLGDTGTYSCIVANSEENIETSTSVQVIRRIVPDENDKCEDKTSLMKCRLIVTARLCGYTMYSKICCNSCKSYYNGRQ